MPLPLMVPSAPIKFKLYPDDDDDISFKKFPNILQSSTVLFVNDTDNQAVTCSSWDAATYPALKLSLLILTVACVVPHQYQLSSLIFRTMLVIGCGTHLIWGLQLCSPDIIFWNSLLTSINVIHCLFILIRLIPSRLSGEDAILFDELFQVYKVDKTDFKNFTSLSKVSDYPEGETYAKEQISIAGTKLSLLISGRMVVTYRGYHLYDITPFEFCDCHEWTWRYNSGETVNPRFQVTLTATEPCRIMVWTTAKMNSMAENLPDFFNVLKLIVSSNALEQLYSIAETNRDEVITTKLFSVS